MTKQIILTITGGMAFFIASCDQEAASPPPTRESTGAPGPDVRRDQPNPAPAPPTGSGTRSDYKPTTGQGGKQDMGR